MAGSEKRNATNLNLTRAAFIAFVVVAVGSAGFFYFSSGDDAPNPQPRATRAGKLHVFWDPFPEFLAAKLVQTDVKSNIHPQDYSGPESCKKCHEGNYESWSHHPHRWMNTMATTETVVGDFSGKAEIHYRGGTGQFLRAGEQFHMSYERDDVTRVYQINQTIGSRFYQYYVGKMIDGPDFEKHAFSDVDHVLPFGYWIDRKTWVPVVHISDELADDKRWEPVDTPTDSRHIDKLTYARACNPCHTTFPLADMTVRLQDKLGLNPPSELFFSLGGYLADAHPDLWDGSKKTVDASNDEYTKILEKMILFEAGEKAAWLGISCEACHLGAKAHAEGKLEKPSFVAHSPFLFTPHSDESIDRGRNHDNVNWICSRCHTGSRPTFAAGMSTWNSTEYSDAIRGSCYSKLTCIHCHDPHKGIGPKWAKTPQQDDASCLSCHAKYESPAVRQNHTHHPAGSSGDRCLNCHMPRLNEGMQDVVRTHMIFSPTQSDMIEANHPNACNLCHLDKPIDWTLDRLTTWYGKTYASEKIAENYPHAAKGVSYGWLKHPNQSVRMVAVEALARNKAKWALPEMIEMLDDNYLLNRQFTQKGLESMLETKLDDYGYWFYMTKKERRDPIQRMRQQYLNK